MTTDTGAGWVRPELAIGFAAAQRASVLCRRLQRSLTSAQRVNKTDGSLVTIADYASQVVVHRALLEADGAGVIKVPAFVSEESADALLSQPGLAAAVVEALAPDMPGVSVDEVISILRERDARWTPGEAPPGHYWCVDPIDGTRGFAAGRHYSVCVAEMKAGQCVTAVVAAPNIDGRFELPGTEQEMLAARGQVLGCVAGGELFESAAEVGAGVTRCVLGREPARRELLITFSVEPSEARVADFAKLAERLGGALPLAMDSQAKYVAVAMGRADVYFRPPRRVLEKVWDHAAGCLLAQVGGCIVSDVRGEGLIGAWACWGQAEGLWRRGRGCMGGW
jgi:3'-phosphoadenosine 5'-phosphosulfate (PAPS) 3'-phosphatase